MVQSQIDQGLETGDNLLTQRSGNRLCLSVKNKLRKEIEDLSQRPGVEFAQAPVPEAYPLGLRTEACAVTPGTDWRVGRSLGAPPLFCRPLLLYAQPLAGRTRSFGAIGRKEGRAQFRIGEITSGTDEALGEQPLLVFPPISTVTTSLP